MNNLSSLFQKIKIKPKNVSIYIGALTHPSYSHEMNLNYNYQRLEFLGDAIIEKIVCEYLYNKYSDASEGELTKEKVIIVQSHTLSLAAKKLELNKYININRSLISSNLEISDNILEDVFESLVAAIYIDLGEKEVNKFLRNTIIHLYEIRSIQKDNLDYKSLLHEKVQQIHGWKIQYVNKLKKVNNVNQYECSLFVNNQLISKGLGYRKKDAEKAAAKKAYLKEYKV